MDEADISRCERLLAQADDSGWLAFSSRQARWVPFSIATEIRTAFADSSGRCLDQEKLTQWMRSAESSLINWIFLQLMAKPNRAALYRSLGRGWIFIHVLRARNQFRWWFESIERVMRKHRDVIEHLRLDEPPAQADQINLLEKYTIGYMVEAEAVVLVNGIVPKAFSPQISIMRIMPDYRDRAAWGLEVQDHVAAENPTDEQRQQYAKTVHAREKARAKRQRAKARKKEKHQEQAMSREARLQNCSAFEDLLNELKLEAAGPEDTHVNQ